MLRRSLCSGCVLMARRLRRTLKIEAHAARSVRLACGRSIFSQGSVGESSWGAHTARHGIEVVMAEMHSTSRRSNFPCLFSSGSGSFNAAPVAGLRQFCGDDRVFFMLYLAALRSWPPSHPLPFGTIVTIESSGAPKLRVTTFGATSTRREAATCW